MKNLKILSNFLTSQKIYVSFLVIFSAFSRFQFNLRMPNLSGEDSFYHVGMAKFILANGIPHHFPYLFYTILNNNFVDHQLLFHLILIPFIKVFGDFNGAKIMTIVFVALSFSFLFLIFKEKKLKLSLFYAIAAFFIMPADFYFRMSFVRVQAPALFLMTLAVYLIFRKKLWGLLVLSFLFVWLYGGFVFMPVLAFLYFIALIFTDEKIDYKLPAAILIGTVLGLVINPYFPHNISFLIVQIFQTGLGAKSYSGGEWRPYDTWFWLTSSLVPVIIFFGSLMIGFIRKQKSNSQELLLVLFSFILLALEWKAKRYVEYWPFWAVASGIFLAGPCFEEKILRGKVSGINLKTTTTILLFIVLAVVSIKFSFTQMHKGLSDTRAFFNVSAAEKANNFLIENSEKGDIVFTDDWDVFPLYFYLNQKNYYIVGLDPEFMNRYDGSLYKEFSGISSGRDSSALERIKRDFNAKWVIVASDHPVFKTNLEHNPDLFNEVYSIEGYTIFKVL